MSNSKIKPNHAPRLLPLAASLILPLLAWDSQAAISAFKVSRDATGNAKLSWLENDGRTFYYDLYRRDDSGATQTCFAALGEVEDNGWCRRSNVKTSYASGTNLKSRTYTDTAISLDPSDVKEYSYRVEMINQQALSPAVAWAPNCAVPVTSPMTDWLAKLNEYLYLSGDQKITWADFNSAPAAENRIDSKPAGALAFGSFKNKKLSTDYYYLASDKYIAVFNQLGTVVSITHRLYGMQFLQAPKNQTETDIRYFFPWRIHMPQSMRDFNPSDSANSLPATASFTNGVLTFSTKPTYQQVAESGAVGASSLGQVSVQWTLSDTGRKGLRGQLKLNGFGNAGEWNAIDRVEFPILNGLGDVNTAQSGLLWPEQNQGTYYAKYPTRTATNDLGQVTSENPAKYGELHTAALAMQFFAINQGEHWLYVGAEDPSFEPKALNYAPFWFGTTNSDPQAKRHINRSSFTLYPRRGDRVDADGLAPNYTFVMTPMCANSWGPVAQHYRNWATTHRADIRRTNTKENLPATLKSGTYWGLSFPGVSLNDPSKIVAAANTLKQKTPGIPLTIHQYAWYRDQFDFNMPRFSPTAPATDGTTLNDAFSQIKQDGNTLIVPYIQAVLTDISDRKVVQNGAITPWTIASLTKSDGAPDNERIKKCMPSLDGISETPYKDENPNESAEEKALRELLAKTYSPANEQNYFNLVFTRLRDSRQHNHGNWETAFNGLLLRDNVIMHAPLTDDGLIRLARKKEQADGTWVDWVEVKPDVPFSCFPWPANTPTGALLAYMDPSTTTWQKVVNDNVKTVYATGASGVYLDSFGIGYYPDYAPASLNRPHGPGHGHWWLGGNKTIGQQTRAANPNGFVATEFFNEGLLPYTDVVTNYEDPLADDTPLVQAVYGDYFVSAGQDINSLENSAEDERNATLGRSFVWGYQLGLTRASTLSGTTPAQYAINLTNAHINWQRYLQHGHIVGPADGSLATGTTVPAIRGGLWEGAPGSAKRALILTNTSSSVQSSSIAIPTSWSGKPAYRCSALGSCETTNVGVAKSASPSVSVTLQPREIVMIEFEK